MESAQAGHGHDRPGAGQLNGLTPGVGMTRSEPFDARATPPSSALTAVSLSLLHAWGCDNAASGAPLVVPHIESLEISGGACRRAGAGQITLLLPPFGKSPRQSWGLMEQRRGGRT